MKNFEITAKGTVTNYIKENAIRAKNELSDAFSLSPGPRDGSCFYTMADLETSKSLSVTL